jgi:hypothetical protein
MSFLEFVRSLNWLYVEKLLAGNHDFLYVVNS